MATLPTMPDAPPPIDDAALAEALVELRGAALELEASAQPRLQLVPEADRPSARNLVHYLALRQHDVRGLQAELARRGLSSLGRAEGHVLATIDAVLARLGVPPDPRSGGAPGATSSRQLLQRHAEAALGAAPASGGARLMVTMPTEAATDRQLVAALVEAGMDLARVNGAHDDPDTWAAIAATVRAEAARAGRRVLVAFDLAGPKLRTGPLGPAPRVVKVQPRRGADGVVQRPARARLWGEGRAAGGDGPLGADDAHVVAVPVGGGLVDGARVGDEIALRDARGRKRRLAVVAVHDGAVDVTTDRTCYLASGTPLQRRRHGEPVASAEVGDLPEVEPFIRVAVGDRVRVHRAVEPGRPAVVAPDGTTLEPARISCELGELFAAVAVGDRVLFDDGAIEAVVEEVGVDAFDVVVRRASSAKLRAGKGINLPDTSLSAPALTDEDRAALEVVAPLADLVSLSFAHSVEDLDDLREALAELGHPELPIGLKVEHPAAFKALPLLLLRALQGPPVAVMVARGDLAIEVGFERLAELQEEVLWLCEAAHLPVIWATQVAESLAKEGLPTRAEVTDAAWAGRAECVMLNKGPHIVEAVRFVRDVLARMQGHQDKRVALLRRLSVSDALGAPAGQP